MEQPFPQFYLQPKLRAMNVEMLRLATGQSYTILRQRAPVLSILIPLLCLLLVTYQWNAFPNNSATFEEDAIEWVEMNQRLIIPYFFHLARIIYVQLNSYPFR